MDMKSRLPIYLIGLVLPIVAYIVCFPIYNRAEPILLGFSFNYFWMFLCLPFTSLCLWLAFRMDPANAEEIAAEKRELDEQEKEGN